MSHFPPFSDTRYHYYNQIDIKIKEKSLIGSKKIKRPDISGLFYFLLSLGLTAYFAEPQVGQAWCGNFIFPQFEHLTNVGAVNLK